MKNKTRIEIIDAVRGICILLMVAFHFGYDWVTYGGAPPELIFNPVLAVLQPLFAGVFIFVSGVSCRLSRGNFKRGVKMLAAGIAVTLVSLLMDAPIWFGILHFLGVAAIFFALFAFAQKQMRLRAFARKYAPPGVSAIGIIGCDDGPTTAFYSDGTSKAVDTDAAPPMISRTIARKAAVLRLTLIAACAVLFAVFYVWLRNNVFETRLFWWLGFKYEGFWSGDYFPILPWIFVYIAGATAGLWVAERRLPAWFYTVRVPFLAACGRCTLIIYLLHQPILYAIVLLLLT